MKLEVANIVTLVLFEYKSHMNHVAFVNTYA